MTNRSTNNGSPTEDAAKSIYADWNNNLAFPEEISSYQALIESLDPETDNPSREDLDQVLIHSEDWAHWSDKQRDIAAQYVNVLQNEFS